MVKLASPQENVQVVFRTRKLKLNVVILDIEFVPEMSYLVRCAVKLVGHVTNIQYGHLLWSQVYCCHCIF